MKAETKRRYSMNFKTKYEKRNGSITIERKAELALGIKTKFSDIVSFRNDAKKILAEVKKAYKRGGFVEVEITAADYRTTWTDDEKINGEQLSFDRWFFAGYQDNDEGLHLEPDTRYTNECHDLWLDYKQDIFEALESI